ncbi:MAG TPA: aldo/keto reductase [Puia sp.]|nr:aldo/keto reductase [Puia sp.]
MFYRQLGKSPLRVSEIGFGCMSLRENDAANERAIHRAIDLGINLFDTADIYGNGDNEECLGKAVSHKRTEVVIATKVGNQLRKDGKGMDWNPRKDYIISSVEQSLKRLNTDYIDLYQLHGGTREDPIEETIEAFETLQQQGKIRFYGISSIRPNVIREYVRRSSIISVMMQYSLLDRRPEETCFELLEKNNIGVLARGSVAKGLLLDKPAEAYLNYSAAETSKAATAVDLLSNEKRNPAQTALRFVLNQKSIAAAVVGIRTLKQLDKAARAVDTPPLTQNELNYLQSILPACRYEQHR